MSCPTGLLVNIDDGNEITLSNKTQASPAKLLSKREIPTKSPSHSVGTNGEGKKEAPKLCGYLTKVSSTGIVKLSKTRWFSYNPETCDLTFKRNPEQEPDGSGQMGRIPLRRASFNFTAASLQDNQFSITSDGTTHNLQASDRKTLMWWIQELQCQRRAFNQRQSIEEPHKPDWQGSIHGSSVFWIPNQEDVKSGLIDVKHPQIESENSSGPTQLRAFRPDEEPPDTVGDQAATLHRPRNSSVLSGNFTVLGNKTLPMPNLGNINTAFTNAGEAAKKTLKNQAQKLRPNMGRSEENYLGGAVAKSVSASTNLNQYILTTNSTNNATDSNDSMGFGSFVKGLKSEILELHDELAMLKMKLQTKEESIQVLKMELDRYEQHCKGKLPPHSVFSNEERKLRSEVISLKLTNERLQQEREESVIRENALKEQNVMLQETLSYKDQVVMQLNNQLHDLEQDHNKLHNDHSKLREEKNEEFVILTPDSSGEDIDQLKDRAEGYMMQNRLLNNEILELASLRQMDAGRLETMHDKVRLKEAQYCQLNSKYLVLLAEMNKPRSESVGLAVSDSKISPSDKDRKDMVKILIQEALAESESSPTMRRESRYDQYGFSTLPEDDAESSLLASAGQMEKRASDIIFSLNEYQASIAAKWQNYFATNRDLQRNEDTKLLIRYGVPHDLRPKVWTWMVKHRTQQMRYKLDPDGCYYKKLTERAVAPLAAKQIELDLLRTLPNNKHFASLSSEGIAQLRRVLRAYSIHNPSIGYCQGLNRIAAVALLYLCEEEAFWCVVAVAEIIMPQDYYSHTLTASQADQRVFRELMAEKLPRLHKHLDTLQVDCSLITFNWLLCIYCDNVPPDTMLHIWDVFLNEGSKVLFRYGLAFFRTVEEEILQLTDYMSIFTFLRVMSHRMHDVRSLTNIAFQTMNPFPMRRINRLRLFHLEKVEAELRDLDVLRKGFVSQRRPAPADRDSDDD
uniref:TBC1 domain family member 2B-like n=1 Tax=Phallusia mammillata TaxID=59560 RepID=A0A6F9DTR0_9ASCI|nr:TBC1 domain family member 2B-like [Phallusia mammillata]